MTGMFHQGSRELQARFDTRRIADRIDEVLVKDSINEHDRAFIESADCFFIATADTEGRPECSYKGGDPGFVRVVDDRTIAFPNFDGNGMYLSMGNLLVNPSVGLLFIDFERGRRLRLNGEASIDQRDLLLAEYPQAQFIVRVWARQLFPNCPRYIHPRRLIERSEFVPREGCRTPVPDWKRAEWRAIICRPATPQQGGSRAGRGSRDGREATHGSRRGAAAPARPEPPRTRSPRRPGPRPRRARGRSRP